MKFEELNIDERILRAIEDMGFEETSPIQTQAIPAVCEGIDVVGQAQTGTGKKVKQANQLRCRGARV